MDRGHIAPFSCPLAPFLSPHINHPRGELSAGVLPAGRKNCTRSEIISDRSEMVGNNFRPVGNNFRPGTNISDHTNKEQITRLQLVSIH